MGTDSEVERRAEILAELRAEFEPLLERLTPELEPAVSYTGLLEKSSEE
jgi:hypothetical protein